MGGSSEGGGEEKGKGDVADTGHGVEIYDTVAVDIVRSLVGTNWGFDVRIGDTAQDNFPGVDDRQ